MSDDSSNLASRGARKKGAWHNLDVFSTVSFIGAGVLGAGTIANNIWQKFYASFVLGFGETDTPFSPIVKKFTGANNAGKQLGEGGKFLDIFKEYDSGQLTPEQYQQKLKATAKEFRHEVETKLEKDFKIPSKGPTGLIVGTWKRWQNLGVTARRDTTIGFATVAAVSLGAVSLLRHNKNTLDNIEDKLDSRSAAAR